MIRIHPDDIKEIAREIMNLMAVERKPTTEVAPIRSMEIKLLAKRAIDERRQKGA